MVCVCVCVCGVSTANSQLIHGKYSVNEFILSTRNWLVMVMGIFGRWNSGMCHTCNEVFVTKSNYDNQIKLSVLYIIARPLVSTF